MTYDDLVAKIKAFTNTDDPESFNPAIQDFVAFAEDRISKELDIDAEVANQETTGTIQAGQRFVNMPPGAKGIYQFRVSPTINGPWTHLQMRTRSWCDDYAPTISATGVPRYYCIYDAATLLVVPTLCQSYYGELTHQVYITGLGPAKQTTWISQHAPELLFEAALAKAAEFQKNPTRAAAHDARYKEILAAEAMQGILRMRDSLRLM